MEAYETRSGALVRVTMKDKQFRGTFSSLVLAHTNQRNPAEDRLVLEDPKELPLEEPLSGSVSFPLGEICQFEVLEYGLFPKEKPEGDDSMLSTTHSQPLALSGMMKTPKSKVNQLKKELEPIEVQLKTYVIREPMQLKVLMKLMKEIDICGLAFEGKAVGRNGIVSWVIMTAGKTLIPIDIDSLHEQMPDLWKTLEKYVFQNGKLVKIMHDGRVIADYLWHAHGIKIVNAFDTQIADALISKDHVGYAPPQLNPLSDCLQMYNRRIPLEELEFLRKYEAMDWTTNESFLRKPLPPPEYLKLCAIKVKHLVPLRENMMTKLLERFNTCVETHLNSLKDRDQRECEFLTKKPRELTPELLDLLEENLGHLTMHNYV